MLFNITSIASYSLNVLTSATEGCVHSVYRKTMNLQTGSGLLALQTASSPISPISLLTELDTKSMEALPVYRNQPVKFSPGRITIYGSDSVIHFCFSEADIFDSKLSAKASLSQDLLKSVLEQSSAGGFRSIFVPSCTESGKNSMDQALIAAAAKQRLCACHACMLIPDYTRAAGELIPLIGLGIGLTPGGDDFLCGVLAGLAFSGKWDHPFASILREKIAANLHNTNDISRSFLLCALSSHFSKPIMDLINPASPGEILASFEAVGHSSGMDSLCGIYYALSLI